MKLSLVPQEREYFRLFSEFAAVVDQAAQLLAKLMNDYHDPKSVAREAVELEHVGDKIVHDIVKRLNKTFITPLDREDIYDLAATLDEVLDSIEADGRHAGRLPHRASLRRMPSSRPSCWPSRPPSCAIALDGLEKRKGLDEHWIEINRLENDGDRLYRDAVAELFDGDMKCTDIIKWKDIYAHARARDRPV